MLPAYILRQVNEIRNDQPGKIKAQTSYSITELQERGFFFGFFFKVEEEGDIHSHRLLITHEKVV